MLNNAVIVGRIKEIKEKLIILNVPRPFKNDEGKYDEDNIEINMSDILFNKTNEYCKINDIVGIKARVECLNEGLKIVACKVTFLSSGKAKENGYNDISE